MNRTWLRIQSNIHRIVYQISGGRVGSYFGAPTLLLTTIGRKSGLPRTTPLFYLEDGQKWAVVASNAGSDQDPAWWLNLQSNPSAQVQIREKQFEVEAYIAQPEVKDRLWSKFVDLFSGYETHQSATERNMPVVILERVPTSEKGD
jgi:F420H(2)-dependent quinone reductase